LFPLPLFSFLSHSSFAQISRKALKTAHRLHKHAETIQKRHENRKTNLETAEKEYLEANQFSTSKKTKVRRRRG